MPLYHVTGTATYEGDVVAGSAKEAEDIAFATNGNADFTLSDIEVTAVLVSEENPQRSIEDVLKCVFDLPIPRHSNHDPRIHRDHTYGDWSLHRDAADPNVRSITLLAEQIVGQGVLHPSAPKVATSAKIIRDIIYRFTLDVAAGRADERQFQQHLAEKIPAHGFRVDPSVSRFA